MRENCFDIGTIQAFLDGELAAAASENVARHVALCDDCAIQLADAEDETAFAFGALEQEFNTLVPTQRLWTKINNSIESERKSFWKSISAFFRNPALATFATFLIVFAVFVAYLNQGNDIQPSASVSTPGNPVQTNPVSDTASINTASSDSVVSLPPVKRDEEAVISTPVRNQNGFRVVKASASSAKSKFAKRDSRVDIEIPPTQPAVYQYLPGEESYIKTIATLEKTIDGRKDEVMKPSTRMTFEKNLALVDNAIDKMRAQIKENPKNEAAKQVLLSSYQNKVDLLNSVAGKTELMASLK